MEPREGIEPPIDDYKSSVIPFNYRGKISSLALFFFKKRLRIIRKIGCKYLIYIEVLWVIRRPCKTRFGSYSNLYSSNGSINFAFPPDIIHFGKLPKSFLKSFTTRSILETKAKKAPLLTAVFVSLGYSTDGKDLMLKLIFFVFFIKTLCNKSMPGRIYQPR